jgi:hypothetical protein
VTTSTPSTARACGARTGSAHSWTALPTSSRALFVQGTTRNQVLFYPRFDHIVLLSAPPEILTARLAARAGNPYGKDPAELAETLEYQRTVEPLLRTSATLEVITTVPVGRVADIVLDHVAAR